MRVIVLTCLACFSNGAPLFVYGELCCRLGIPRRNNLFPVRGSISSLAGKLEPYGFIRIHRSVLDNTSFVEEIHPCTTCEYVLRIKGGKELTVSRTYKKNLKSIAQFWVGTNGPFAE